MAKCRIALSDALNKLFVNADGVAVHRAWVHDGDLVLDLRGPAIPDDAAEVSPEFTSWEETRTETWTCFGRKFVKVEPKPEFWVGQGKPEAVTNYCAGVGPEDWYDAGTKRWYGPSQKPRIPE